MTTAPSPPTTPLLPTAPPSPPAQTPTPDPPTADPTAPPLPIPTVEAPPSFLDQIDAWGSLGSGLFGGIAALAAVAAARAAIKQAKDSTRAARDSLEALARTTAPRLTSFPFNGTMQTQMGRESEPVIVEIDNSSVNRGLILEIELRWSNGDFIRTAQDPMPVPIAGVGPAWDPDTRRIFQLGTMPRLLPDAPDSLASSAESAISEVLVVLDVVYADAAQVMRWRQRSRFQEHVEMRSDRLPMYSYKRVDESEPEMIGAVHSDVEGPPGVIRRAWRWLW